MNNFLYLNVHYNLLIIIFFSFRYGIIKIRKNIWYVLFDKCNEIHHKASKLKDVEHPKSKLVKISKSK